MYYYKPTINLSKAKIGDGFANLIDHKVNHYPDGQKDLYFSDDSDFWWVNAPKIHIVHDALDPFLIASAVASVKRLSDAKIHLYVPYVRGSRSDRKFIYGGSNYIGDVLAPFIDSINITSFSTYDAHNDNAFDLALQNTKFINIEPYHLWAASLGRLGKDNVSDIVVIAPDDNAMKKIEKGFKYYELTNRIISCTKRRNDKGEIVGTKIQDIDESMNADNVEFVLIDDIGDGFGTFIRIAEELENMGYKNKKHLVVSHIIQEEGLVKALNKFDTVFTTNSTGDWKREDVVEVQNVFNLIF